MVVESSSVCAEEVVSPSLTAQAGDAFELKFVVKSEEAAEVEGWARERLVPDPHGRGGTYRTTSLYLDTPFFDVYHKSPGYRRSKYRLRRYGDLDVVHLERKTRRGDRVRKQREVLPLADLPRLVQLASTEWFGQRVQQRGLQPVCWIGYTRTAFQGTTSEGPVRLTLDREAVGTPSSALTVPAEVHGRNLLPDQVILELKFRSALPGLFRDLLERMPLRLASMSKYRRCVELWQLARGRV